MQLFFRQHFYDYSDRWVLVTCLVIGLAVIFVPSFYAPLAIPNFVKLVAMILIIVGYTGFVFFARKHTNSVSLDKCADNAYYLGLIFTLCSLLATLWLFDSQTEQMAATLLNNFGVALASTVAGVVCRVWLQQLSNDPTDVELTARRELGNSMKQLRSSIGNMIMELNTLTEQTKLSHAELSEKVIDTIAETSRQSASTISAATKQSADEIRTASEYNAKAIVEVGQKLQTLEQQYKEMALEPENFEKKLAATINHVTSLTKATEENVALQLRLNQQLTQAHSKMTDLLASMQLHQQVDTFDNFVGSLRSIAGDFKNLATLSGEIHQGMSTATNTVNQASVAINDETSQFKDNLREVENVVVGFIDELTQTTKSMRHIRDQRDK